MLTQDMQDKEYMHLHVHVHVHVGLSTYRVYIYMHILVRLLHEHVYASTCTRVYPHLRTILLLCCNGQVVQLVSVELSSTAIVLDVGLLRCAPMLAEESRLGEATVEIE